MTREIDLDLPCAHCGRVKAEHWEFLKGATYSAPGACKTEKNFKAWKREDVTTYEQASPL